MSALTDFEAGFCSPGYYLEIDGFELVPYGPVEPTVTSGHLTAGRTARRGLRGVSAVRASLDIKGGIVDSSPVAVTMIITRDNGLEAMLRTAPDGADRYATLAVTVPKDPAAGVALTVNEDVSAWPVPGVVWIGQEAMRYTAIVGTDELTVPAGSRGYYASPVQEHVANAAEGWAPRVYSHCVTWEGRPARVRLVSVRMGRTLTSGFVDICNGFIAGDPVLGPDGLLEVMLQPWSAAVDRKIGGEEAQTGLQHGGHVHDGETGYLIGGNVYTGFDQGAAFDERTDGTASPGAVINGIRWEGHADCFDPTQSDNRMGRLLVSTEGFAVHEPDAAPYGGDAQNGSITLTNALATGIVVNQYARVQNLPATEGYDLEIGTPGSVTFVEHPEETLELINAAWQPGTVDGAAGRFADIRIDRNHPDVGGPALSIRMNTESHARQGHLSIVSQAREMLWYGIDLAEPGASRPRPLDQIPLAQQGHWPARRIALQSRRTPTTARDVVPIRGVADAYWAQERYLYVEDDVFSAAPFYIRATWEEDGEPKETRPLIVGKQAASVLFAGRPGVILEVDDQDRWGRLPFGDWPGGQRVVIRELVAWSAARPTDVLAQLLISGQGDGHNGADDVLPYGCDIHEDFVDRDSFSNFPVPPGVVSEWTTAITEEREVLDLAGNLLQALAGALVDRLNLTTGVRRLAIVAIGPPVWVDAVAVIKAGDWLRDGLPSSDLAGEIVNSLTFHTGGEESPVPPITVNNRDSIGELRRTANEELELEGVVLPPASPVDHKAALLPLAADIFAARGYKRRMVRGLLPWYVVHRLDVGAVVTVNAEEVRDPQGQLGITNATMRVLAIEPRPDGGDAEVGLVWYGSPTTGWAPSMRFLADVSATVFTVEANYYTELVHPITGAVQRDVDYFAVGNSIVMVPDGRWSDRKAVAIVAIVGNQVEVDAAPGFVAGDQVGIDPAAYDTASAAHQRYAYLADDDETLGAAGDPAYEYA